MNNLDDFLNSLGISQDPPPEQTAPVLSAPQPAESPALVVQSLTESEFNDILRENGFIEPDYADAEEITEEESEEEEESTDIPSIEDYENSPNMQEALESVGNLIEEDPTVHFHMPDGSQIDVPIVVQEPENPDSQLIEIAESILAEASTPQEELAISPNSPTLLIDEATSRFSGTEWYNEIKNARVILAGLGGIGSNAAFQIARMSPMSMFLYDDDVVEAANMSGQLYGIREIEQPKVNAVINVIRNFTIATGIHAINEKFTSSTEAGNIMICGFDNMRARKVFFNAWLNHVRNPETAKRRCLFIDGRLSISVLQVFCLTGDDDYNIERYKNEYLFSDEEADETVCSMKQTTYLACMIGSVITNLFTNFIANSLNPIIPYALPFFTEYDAQHMIFKAEN